MTERILTLIAVIALTLSACGAVQPTADDAVDILKHIVELEVLSAEQIAALDFDGDGALTPNDAIEVLKFVAGLPNVISGIPPEYTEEHTEDTGERFALSPPAHSGSMSVEQALAERRSAQLSQILWAAYGITSANGLRTSPSAGACYPLEIYAVVGNAEGIAPGVYRYIPAEHALVQTVAGDVRVALSEAAVGQQMIAAAPAAVFYSAVFERITERYGERGIMYTHMEAGHSAQNVYLQAEALGLGTCAVGAFIEPRAREVLRLPEDEFPLYLMPFGYTE
jgi:SagB-type dehydrogenase family enzyme